MFGTKLPFHRTGIIFQPEIGHNLDSKMGTNKRAGKKTAERRLYNKKSWKQACRQTETTRDLLRTHLPGAVADAYALHEAIVDRVRKDPTIRVRRLHNVYGTDRATMTAALGIGPDAPIQPKAIVQRVLATVREQPPLKNSPRCEVCGVGPVAEWDDWPWCTHCRSTCPHPNQFEIGEQCSCFGCVQLTIDPMEASLRGIGAPAPQ